MDHSEEKKVDPKRKSVCFIRLTPEEHERLKRDVLRSGKTATALVRNAYFEKSPLVLLMSDPDRDHFFAQVHRIGNSVNQISRQINSGFAYGFEQDLETVRSQLTILITWLTAKYRAFKV